jgi:hypothetical protein
MGDGWKSWKTLVWWTQVAVLIAWTGLSVGLWVAWTAGSMAEIDPSNEGATGMAVIITSSCCGLSWVLGLVPIALCFWLLKGPQ